MQQSRQKGIDRMMLEKKSEVAKLQREKATWEKKIKAKVLDVISKATVDDKV
jgi:hypothetical protein